VRVLAAAQTLAVFEDDDQWQGVTHAPHLAPQRFSSLMQALLPTAVHCVLVPHCSWTLAWHAASPFWQLEMHVLKSDSEHVHVVPAQMVPLQDTSSVSHDGLVPQQNSFSVPHGSQTLPWQTVPTSVQFCELPAPPQHCCPDRPQPVQLPFEQFRLLRQHPAGSPQRPLLAGQHASPVSPHDSHRPWGLQKTVPPKQGTGLTLDGQQLWPARPQVGWHVPLLLQL
jgi:hypothetical protein